MYLNPTPPQNVPPIPILSHAGPLIYLNHTFHTTNALIPVPHRRHPDPAPHTHQRLALLVDTVVHEVLIERDLAGRVDDDDGAAAVVEGAQTIPAADLGAQLVDAVDVLDGADQHGAHGHDGGRRPVRVPPDRHDGALVLAEDVQRAGFVDGLRVAGKGKGRRVSF